MVCEPSNHIHFFLAMAEDQNRYYHLGMIIFTRIILALCIFLNVVFAYAVMGNCVADDGPAEIFKLKMGRGGGNEPSSGFSRDKAKAFP